MEILSLGPSFGELMRAARWVNGDGDHDARHSYTLRPPEDEIVAILSRIREGAPRDDEAR